MKTLLCLLFGAWALGLLTAQDSAPSLTGSMGADMGWLVFREGIPQGSLPDWYAASTAQAVLTGENPASRYRIAAWMDYDLHEDRWNAVLDEAWSEWHPVPAAGLRLGRFRHSQGPGQAFNPTNPFGQRDMFDPRTGARGRDGLRLEWDASPLLVAGTAFLPTDKEPPIGLERSGAAFTALVLLPEAGILGSTEAGVTSARAAGSGSWVSGGWLSTDLDGWVAGAEASWDGAAKIAFTLNRTFGEVFAVAEAQYIARDPAWMGFVGLSWTQQEWEAAAAALADFQAGAARTSLEVRWNASDILEVAFQGSANFSPEKWTLPGPLPALFTLGVGARWYL